MTELKKGVAGERRRKATSRRTQPQRRLESEQRLLTAAAEIIGREGFASASFERLGEEAGYSRGLASQKFGSKDGLITAVIAFVSKRIEQAVTKETQGAPDALTAVLNHMNAILTTIEKDPLSRAYFVTMAAAISNRLPIQAAFLEEHNLFRVRTRERIEEGKAAGVIEAAIDADSTAIAIGSLLLGIAMELLLDPELDVGRVRKVTLATVQAALAPGKSAPKAGL